MAYEGYLIKVGDYTIPLGFIRAETYKPTNYGQDLDSYQDTDGILHRQAIENQAPKVEFETKPLITDDELWEVLWNIQRNYTDPVEKKANVNVYIPELHRYVASDMYLADLSPSIYQATGEEIKYNSFRMAFISYGVKTI